MENHLKEMILKTFDPKKADTIFTEEGEVSFELNFIVFMYFKLSNILIFMKVRMQYIYIFCPFL